VVLIHPARDHLPSPAIKCLYLPGVVVTLECPSISKRRFEWHRVALLGRRLEVASLDLSEPRKRFCARLGS
jgi:hypothetical protein